MRRDKRHEERWRRRKDDMERDECRSNACGKRSKNNRKLQSMKKGKEVFNLLIYHMLFFAVVFSDQIYK